MSIVETRTTTIINTSEIIKPTKDIKKVINKSRLQCNLEKIEKKIMKNPISKHNKDNCESEIDSKIACQIDSMRGSKHDCRGSRKKKKVIVWDNKTINNEFLNRKKTNCCIPALKDNKIVAGCRHH